VTGSAGGVVVRPYAAGDRDACRDLWVELTDVHRTLYESPGIGGPDPGLQFDDHLKRVGAHNLWVAEVGGRVVGLTGMIPGDGEAELEPLVASESLRGRGIGGYLVEAVVAAARDAGLGTLSVRPAGRNADALRYFHGRGFRIIGQVELITDLTPGPGPWRDGESLAGRRFTV
jgi:GNAT superfamily N-acetyltransferase